MVGEQEEVERLEVAEPAGLEGDEDGAELAFAERGSAIALPGAVDQQAGVHLEQEHAAKVIDTAKQRFPIRVYNTRGDLLVARGE